MEATTRVLAITFNAESNAVLETVSFDSRDERDIVVYLLARKLTTERVMEFAKEHGCEYFGLILNGKTLPDLECDHGGDEHYHADRIYEAIKAHI